MALAGSLALAGCTGGTFEEAAGDAGESERGRGTRPKATTARRRGGLGVAHRHPRHGFRTPTATRTLPDDEGRGNEDCAGGLGATVSGEGAAVEGSTVIITAAGTYVVSGELTAGSLTVNAGDADKVQIVLSGASIRNEVGSALNIQQADKVFVTLAAGSQVHVGRR